jgi:hypothetical protein
MLEPSSHRSLRFRAVCKGQACFSLRLEAASRSVEYDLQTTQRKPRQGRVLSFTAACVFGASCSYCLTPWFKGTFLEVPALTAWENPFQTGEPHTEHETRSPITIDWVLRSNAVAMTAGTATYYLGSDKG